MLMSSSDTVRTPRVKGSPRKHARITLLIFIYVGILFINGLDEFLKSGFDLEFMFTSQWYSKVTRVLFSNILIFIGTFLHLLDSALQNRQDIITERGRLDAIASTRLDPVTFDPFFIKFERQRKIKFYKRAMETRLEKLENKAKLTDMELWRKQQKNYDSDGNIVDHDINDQFLNNKFCQKKQTILKQLKPEFIESHIGYMRVGYRPNSKSFVTNGYNKPSTKYDDYAIEPRSLKLLYDLGPKFLILAGALIILESIIVEFVMLDSWIVAFWNMIIKVVPLLIQIYFAWSYRDIYIKEKIMVDLKKRSDIMTLYLASINKKGVEV